MLCTVILFEAIKITLVFLNEVCYSLNILKLRLLLFRRFLDILGINLYHKNISSEE
jgi:hypothetical protein